MCLFLRNSNFYRGIVPPDLCWCALLEQSWVDEELWWQVGQGRMGTKASLSSGLPLLLGGLGGRWHLRSMEVIPFCWNLTFLSQRGFSGLSLN